MRILSVGGNAELLWLREAVLKAEGFDVFTTSDLKHAKQAVETSNYSVLLLCYSLPLLGRQQLAETFRRKSQGRIVVITNERLDTSQVDADAFVYGMEGPEALVAAIQGDEAHAL